MGQRVEFRFGKKDSFECDLTQIMARTPNEPFEMALERQWAAIKSSGGGVRFINIRECTQIILGIPDKEEK